MWSAHETVAGIVPMSFLQQNNQMRVHLPVLRFFQLAYRALKPRKLTGAAVSSIGRRQQHKFRVSRRWLSGVPARCFFLSPDGPEAFMVAFQWST